MSASVAALCCGDANGLFKVSQAVKDIAQDVKVGAMATAAAAKTSGAGCNMVAAKYEHDAGYAAADARSAQGRQELVSADIDEALERFSGAVGQQSRAVRLTGDIQRQSSASEDAVLNNWGAVA